MLKIMFICYGNICRSPAAEGIFNHQVANSQQLIMASADSAGTHDFHIGKRPDIRTVRQAARYGINLSDSWASQVTEENFYDYDWLVVMDDHNIQCLKEVAPKSQWHKVIRLADFHPSEAYTYVPDPFKGSHHDFKIMFESMWIMIERMLESMVSSTAAHPDQTSRAEPSPWTGV
jgi:protein-tyrosine phosphatase